MRLRVQVVGLIVLSVVSGFEARKDANAASQEAPSVAPDAELIDLQPMRDYTPEEIGNHQRALAAIQEVRKSLVAKSDEELLQILRGKRLAFIGENRTQDYFVARDTNRMIEAALRKRGALALPTLEAHQKDSRGIFMQHPDIKTIGNLCHKLLIEVKATEAATLDQKLIISSYNGDAANVRKLLAEGAHVDARYGAPGHDVMDTLGAVQWTALYAVSDSSRAADPLVIAKLLVEAGASVDLCDAIHAAFPRRHDPAMMDLLIDHGANVNAQNCNGDSPLHFAVRDRDIEIVKRLLKAGADVNIRNERREIPLHALSDVAKAKVLLAAGARRDVKDADGFTPLMKNEWTQRGIWLEHEAYIRA